jgi:phosphoglycerate dehydrogenase-like enzyme
VPADVLVSHIYERHHFDRLAAEFPHVRFTRLSGEEPWPAVVANASALLFAGLTKPLLSRLLQASPRLEWIQTGSAGFDWVMVPEVEQRGIIVTRSLDVMSIPIAEFVLAAMLRNAKRFVELQAAQARHEWKPPFHQELRAKEVLVVGAGSIGTRVARLCAAFGMRVVGVSRSGLANDAFHSVHVPAALDTLLPTADYVVLTAPGTPETEGMIDARRLGMMKTGSYLINVARGSLVVDADLIAALESGRLAGACLDAFREEPLSADSPLWQVENLFISPHSSYRTPEIRSRVIDEFAANLTAYLEGRPLVGRMRNKELGY